MVIQVTLGCLFIDAKSSTVFVINQGSREEERELEWGWGAVPGFRITFMNAVQSTSVF
jgi:hypothetical protein